MLDLMQPTKQAITRRGGDLANHPAAAYLASLGNGSRRPQRQALNAITNIMTSGALSDCLLMDWAAVQYTHAAIVRNRLAEVYAPATANRMLAALRGVLRAAWRLGLMSSDDYTSAADVKPVIGSTLPAGRGLASGEIAALFDNCLGDKNANSGTRDAAIIAVMYVGGLRRAEVVSLDLADYDPAENKLTFTGKRNKQRTSHLTDSSAAAAVTDWLKIRGAASGPLFLAINKSDKVRPSARLTSQAVYNMLEKRATAAGLAHFSPHDLRRTCISDLLDKGADLATVAGIVGHSNVQTTARYDRRPEQARAKAQGLLHVPYKSRVK